jgi:hypothetical protein
LSDHNPRITGIWKGLRINLQTKSLKNGQTFKCIVSPEPGIKNKDIMAVFFCGQRENGEQLFSHSTGSQNGGNRQQEEFKLNVRINFLTKKVVKC